MKFFEINCSIDPVPPQQHRGNLTLFVVADSAQQAVQLAMEAHPTASIWQVQHKGRWSNEQLIIAPELLEMMKK